MECVRLLMEQLAIANSDRATLLADCEMMRATLNGIANANYRTWGNGTDTAYEFFLWAQSRARHAMVECRATNPAPRLARDITAALARKD